MAEPIAREKEYVNLLLELSLKPGNAASLIPIIERLSAREREDLLVLADCHHIILRSFETLLQAMPDKNSDTAQWLAKSIASEKARIANALDHLNQICEELEHSDCPVVVMKSLDHWPDIGNDLDLYTTGDEENVHKIFLEKFDAQLEAPSWGDRLANKSNFAIPGLRELVEVHVQRLGQTGEHTTLARRFVRRRVSVKLGGYRFFVPAPEERVIVATLQRMYRHFYARVCDIVNIAQLVDSQMVDFEELQLASQGAGIWQGVATFLMIVSDYVRHYRGYGLELPVAVAQTARFGGSLVVTRKRFLRIPMWPQGARLYTSQLAQTALRGRAAAVFRLSLLPGLASAAAVAAKLTGSDKGIW